jgi:hypothetical protein
VAGRLDSIAGVAADQLGLSDLQPLTMASRSSTIIWPISHSPALTEPARCAESTAPGAWQRVIVSQRLRGEYVDRRFEAPR